MIAGSSWSRSSMALTSMSRPSTSDTSMAARPNRNSDALLADRVPEPGRPNVEHQHQRLPARDGLAVVVRLPRVHGDGPTRASAVWRIHRHRLRQGRPGHGTTGVLRDARATPSCDPWRRGRRARMRHGARPQLHSSLLPSAFVRCCFSHDYIGLCLRGKRPQLRCEKVLNGWQRPTFADHGAAAPCKRPRAIRGRKADARISAWLAVSQRCDVVGAVLRVVG